MSLVAGYLDAPLIKCSVNKRNSVGIEGTPWLKFLQVFYRCLRANLDILNIIGVYVILNSPLKLPAKKVFGLKPANLLKNSFRGIGLRRFTNNFFLTTALKRQNKFQAKLCESYS